MKRRYAWIAALLVMGWAVATTAEEQPAAGVEQQVEAELERFVAAVNAADWEAVVDFFASDRDFFWIEDGAVRYRSQEEVAEAYAGLQSSFSSFEFRITDLRVVPLGPDVAAAGMLFEQTMTTTADASFEIAGAILTTMVARDGGWKFLNGHTSARPRDAPEAAQE